MKMKIAVVISPTGIPLKIFKNIQEVRTIGKRYLYGTGSEIIFENGDLLRVVGDTIIIEDIIDEKEENYGLDRYQL